MPLIFFNCEPICHVIRILNCSCVCQQTLAGIFEKKKKNGNPGQHPAPRVKEHDLDIIKRRLYVEGLIFASIFFLGFLIRKTLEENNF